MRSAAVLLMMIAAVMAWKVNVSVSYYNPSAAKVLAVPKLFVTVTADYNPLSGFTNFKVKVISTSSLVEAVVSGHVKSYLQSCAPSSLTSPLMALITCVMDALRQDLNVGSVEQGNARADAGLMLNGIGYVRYTSKVSISIAGTTFYGLINYVAELYKEVPVESYFMIASNGNAYIKVEGKSEGVSEPGYYAKVSGKGIEGMIVLTKPPLGYPKVKENNGSTYITFATPIVKYFIGISGISSWGPNTIMMYFSNPVKTVVIPWQKVTVSLLSKPLPTLAANCYLNLVVAARGEHEVSVTLGSYALRSKVKPFSQTPLPVPCNGSALIKVDNSYALLDLNKTISLPVIVFPRTPTLRAVVVNSTSPIAFNVNGTLVKCGTACVLLLPPRQLTLDVVSLVGKGSSKVLIAPNVAYIKVNVPTSVPSYGCLVKFVSPVQTTVTVSTGNSVFSMLVGRTPYSVALPCGKEVEVKVGSYVAKVIVKNGEWIYLCPSDYGPYGDTLNINVTGFKLPISVSCDGGLNWALVNNSTFTMVKPKYAYLQLKVVGAAGKSAVLIVPEGIKYLKVVPTVMPSGKKVTVPKTSLSAVEKIIVSGIPKVIVTISNGTAYVSYPVKGWAYVALPKAWLSTPLLIQASGGGRLINATVPPIYSKDVPAVAPIYIMASNKMIVNYHSLKIALFRGAQLATAYVTINGHKVLVNGTLIVVVPDNVVNIKVGKREYQVLANGGTFKVSLPVPKLSVYSVPLEISVYLNGKPARARVTLISTNVTVSYTINGTETVLVPKNLLTSNVTLQVEGEGTICSTPLPPIQSKVGNAELVSPIVIELKKGSNECYALKLVAVTGTWWKRPARTVVLLDGKYKLYVPGSLILVYYKPLASLRYDERTLVVPVSGTVTLSVVEHVKPTTTAQKPQVVNVVEAIKKAGKWNPLGELPGMLSLGVGMLLALGVLNSGIAPDTPLTAAAFVLASISFIIGLVTLAVILTRYFVTS